MNRNGSTSAAKTALITGVGGHDGALAHLLLGKGYRVFGTSRDADDASRFDSLARLGILRQVSLISMAPNDFKSTLMAISKARPDEIYHLAGQPSVGLSFEQPSETIESITIGTLNILESLRFLSMPARFYHASSGECFGDTGGTAADEQSPFSPVSPYAVAKCAAHWLVRNYRQAHDVYAAKGIVFNHESVLRAHAFCDSENCPICRPHLAWINRKTVTKVIWTLHATKAGRPNMSRQCGEFSKRTERTTS